MLMQKCSFQNYCIGLNANVLVQYFRLRTQGLQVFRNPYDIY